MTARRPPGLLVRTMVVTFVTTMILLGVIFFVVTLSVRTQVRQTAQSHLESSQRMFAASQLREQRSQRLQAATVAESPTLKAAMDTYAAETATATPAVRSQLLNTIREELSKVAERIAADAIVVVDASEHTLAAAGPMAAAWPAGDLVSLAGTRTEIPSDGVIHIGAATFRIVVVPLMLDDGTAIGSLYLATSLDQRFAQQLGDLAGARTAIVSGGQVVASTLPHDLQTRFAAAIASPAAAQGTLDLGGEHHAFRKLFETGDTSFYALTSIDEASRTAIGRTTTALGYIGLGAICLALLGSIWMAHRLSRPIERLSDSIQGMAASRRFGTRLAATGSSLELDKLTETFNALMASVAAAEAETEAAYTAAIRALAAALDARDPYTAGHSERVSALAVAIGRAMSLSLEDLEVLRLGALLHDIGKIGVSDEILRKPAALTAAEFDAIKQHPVLGARILRHVPFLSRHIAIVELHHERPDGRGYPHGLAGDAIPMAAHIVHVADAFDAMTSARAYRPGRPAADALRELRNCAGTDFHADVVAAFALALPAVSADVPELAAPEVQVA